MMSSGMAASSWCMRQSDSCDSLSSDSDTDTESESESLSGSMNSLVSVCTVDAGTVLGCEKTKNSYITKDVNMTGTLWCIKIFYCSQSQFRSQGLMGEFKRYFM